MQTGKTLQYTNQPTLELEREKRLKGVCQLSITFLVEQLVCVFLAYSRCKKNPVKLNSNLKH